MGQNLEFFSFVCFSSWVLRYGWQSYILSSKMMIIAIVRVLHDYHIAKKSQKNYILILSTENSNSNSNLSLTGHLIFLF